MSVQLRADVWNGMVHTDGLVRYYGELAGRLAWREKATAFITSLFATLGLIVSLIGWGPGWTSVAVAIAVATSLVPLIYRLSGAVTSATYCQKRLGDLMVEWRALWQEVDSLPAEDVRERWRRLDKRMNEITSLMSSGKMDVKLRDSTEEEADAYWEIQKNNQIARQTDPRYALPAV